MNYVVVEWWECRWGYLAGLPIRCRTLGWSVPQEYVHRVHLHRVYNKISFWVKKLILWDTTKNRVNFFNWNTDFLCSAFVAVLTDKIRNANFFLGWGYKINLRASSYCAYNSSNPFSPNARLRILACNVSVCFFIYYLIYSQYNLRRLYVNYSFWETVDNSNALASVRLLRLERSRSSINVL